MTPILHREVGLHQHVEIIYVVDGYIASFWQGDDSPMSECEAHGETIVDALMRLEDVMKEIMDGQKTRR